MYFRYEKENRIVVPSPFNRIITPIMTSDKTDKDIDFSVHMTEWESGAKVDEHLHETATEVMYCISGRGVAVVDGVEYDFIPDSMITALPMMKHQIINTGDESLKVLCIFSPAVSGKDLKNRAESAVKEYNDSL